MGANKTFQQKRDRGGLLGESEEFKRLLPNAELFWIDKCGHAPMMEVPEEFNVILDQFLRKNHQPVATLA